jgi:O-antigen/teichoic acid export membrane protein
LCFHGRNILLNLFFGPALNAAYGLAMQVNSAVHSFSSNFMTAIKPQIIKTYAEGDKDYLYKLLFWGAKLSFFPLVVMAVPIIFNVEFVLNLWLKNVPDYTPIFVILTLVNVMSESISQPLVVAMLATGKIRNYQIVVGGMALMNVPAAYVWLRCGGSPICIFVVSIVISQLCFYLRLYMLRGMIGLPVKEFFFKVYVRAILVLLFSLMIPYMFVHICQINYEIVRFLVVCAVSIVSSFVAITFVGCANSERSYVIRKIKKRIHLSE